YAFRPQSQALISFFSARPHNVYQRCVGQWWRIIGRSLTLASIYLKKTAVSGFFQQNLYLCIFFIQKLMTSTIITPKLK
ncbi:hypothetical protein, partial [Photorhabdus sp. RM96S]